VSDLFYYEPTGESRYRPTRHVQGAWNRHEQHMAPVAGLLAHVIEGHDPHPDLQLARISYDILGLIPLQEGVVVVRTLRPGRTIELVEASLEIEGRTLGVVGLGKLGAKVSGLAKAFGMNVIAWSPNLTPERCKEVGVGYASKEELFAAADIVTVHMVLSQRSHGLIGQADLARMKPTSYLVNTARGPLIDEPALIAALDAGQVGGAALDVVTTEPLAKDSPLLGRDNVIISPHTGFYSIEALEELQTKCATDVARVLSGEKAVYPISA